MSDIPWQPPEIVNVQIDEESQMQKYLADIALHDLQYSTEKVNKAKLGSLRDQYAKNCALRHAEEAYNDRAEVVDVEEILVQEVSRTSVPRAGSASLVRHDVAEFIGEKD